MEVEQAQQPADILAEAAQEPVDPAWKYFTQEQLQQYSQHKHDPDAAASLLAEVLKLPDYRFDARSAIRLDYASYALEFALDAGYGPVRTATLFNIAWNLLEVVASGASFADAETTLKAQLLEHVSPRPMADGPQFSPDQVAQVGQYFAKTIFRHYRLYSFVFTHDQALTEYTTNLLVETALDQPFDQATPQMEWIALQQQRKADEEAVRKAAEEAELAQQEADRQAAEEYARAQADARRQEELGKTPATLEEAIAHMVALKMESEKQVMAQDYKEKEEVLMRKIADLEGRLPQAPPPLIAEKSKK